MQTTTAVYVADANGTSDVYTVNVGYAVATTNINSTQTTQSATISLAGSVGAVTLERRIDTTMLTLNTTSSINVFMRSSSDHASAAIGASLNLSISKAGSAFASVSRTINELGSGVYAITLTTSDTDTLGELMILATATGCDNSIIVATVSPGYSTSSEVTTVLNAVSSMSVSTSAVNAPAVGFTLNSGTVVSGTYLDTLNLNGTSHIIQDNLTAFNIEYLFDIGLNSAPSQLTFVGKVTDTHETAIVSAWNYGTSVWDVIGSIPGTKALGATTFTLYKSHTGTASGEIGDVKIRFTSATISDIIMNIDQLYVSYAVVPKESGYSGHAVTATTTQIQLGSDASSVNDYYVPSLLTVNHGTGAQQYAKVIGYTGSTKTLQLELPMAVTLDSTSHITLSPWAQTGLTKTEFLALQ